jgi:hypothetical protein
MLLADRFTAGQMAKVADRSSQSVSAIHSDIRASCSPRASSAALPDRLWSVVIKLPSSTYSVGPSLSYIYQA